MYEWPVNPFPDKPWFLTVCSTSLLKTQWEKEKLLVTSNFSFSHSIFYPFVQLSTIFIKSKNAFRMYEWPVNPFPNKTWFLTVYSTSLLKTQWEKEKLLVTSNFSFSNSVFYPFVQLSTIFIISKIVVCKLFQFGRV